MIARRLLALAERAVVALERIADAAEDRSRDLSRRRGRSVDAHEASPPEPVTELERAVAGEEYSEGAVRP